MSVSGLQKIQTPRNNSTAQLESDIGNLSEDPSLDELRDFETSIPEGKLDFNDSQDMAPVVAAEKVTGRLNSHEDGSTVIADQIEGNVTNLDDSLIFADIDSGYGILGDDSTLVGDVGNETMNILSDTENSKVIGDVDSTTAISEADESYIIGNIGQEEPLEQLFFASKNSMAVGRNIKAQKVGNSHGFNKKVNLVAAENLEAEEIVGDTVVIDDENYHGEFEALEQYLHDNFEGKETLEPFKAFNNGEHEDIEELRKNLKGLQMLWEEDKKQYKQFNQVNFSLLDELNGENRERHSRLQNFRSNISAGDEIHEQDVIAVKDQKNEQTEIYLQNDEGEVQSFSYEGEHDADFIEEIGDDFDSILDIFDLEGGQKPEDLKDEIKRIDEEFRGSETEYEVWKDLEQFDEEDLGSTENEVLENLSELENSVESKEEYQEERSNKDPVLVKNKDEFILKGSNYTESFEYEGGFDEVLDKLNDFDAESLKLLDIEEDFSSIENLGESLEEIEEMFKEAEDSYNEFRRTGYFGRGGLHKLPELDGSNKEILSRLRGFETNLSDEEDFTEKDTLVGRDGDELHVRYETGTAAADNEYFVIPVDSEVDIEFSELASRLERYVNIVGDISDEEEYERLLNEENLIKNVAQEEYGLTQEAAEALTESKDSNYLIRNISKSIKAKRYEEFLIKHSGDIDEGKSRENVLLDSNLENGSKDLFSTEEEILNQEDLNKDDEEFYEEAKDLLLRFGRSGGQFDIDEEWINREISVLKDLREEKKSEKIESAKDGRGGPEQELIAEENLVSTLLDYEIRRTCMENAGFEFPEVELGKYNGLNSLNDVVNWEKGEINVDNNVEELKEEIENTYKNIRENDLSTENEGELNRDDVRDGLGDLTNHGLDEEDDLTEDAEYLTKRIVVEDEENDADKLSFQLYDKDLNEMPNVEEYPCTFPESKHEQFEHNFIKYMDDPGTQIGIIESDDGRQAYGIFNVVRHEEKHYLHVHSIESEDNLTESEARSKATKRAVENFAKSLNEETHELEALESEINIDGVMYNLDGHNPASISFNQKALECEDEYSENEIEVEKIGKKDLHFDNDFPEDSTIPAYVKEF